MASKTFTCVLLPPWDRHEITCTNVIDMARWTAHLGGETIDQYRPSMLMALSDWMATAKPEDTVYLDEDLTMTDKRERADFALACN